jgi:hypothetical protein
MNRNAPIIVALALGLLPIGALAANLDDVTMHVMDANEHAIDVTNNIEIPDQAVQHDGNHSEQANEKAGNGESPDSVAGQEGPEHMDQHAIDAIQGTPAEGKSGGDN